MRNIEDRDDEHHVNRKENRAFHKSVKTRSCVTKRRFRDRQEAFALLKRLRVIKGDRFEENRVYECPFCNGFHTTKKMRTI